METDVRYQVFVSSTFRDLTEERREVMQCLLDMDCIPAGMELFPAADDTAWKLITRVIDQSDYYVLIIGGRYGSIDASGISYTEREYDYAVSVKRSVLPFLHEHPDQIPAGKSEMEPTARTCLERFRQKVQDAHHCKHWNSPHDLAGKVSRSLIATIKGAPAIGWVRGDQARRIEDVQRLADLQQKVGALEQENAILSRAQDAVLAKRVPRIATEYSPLFRVLRLYIELVPPPESKDFNGQTLRDAVTSCGGAYEQVATLVAEFDRAKHPGVYYTALDVLRALTPLRTIPRTVTDATKWKNDASTFLSLCENLDGIIQHENWGPE